MKNKTVQQNIPSGWKLKKLSDVLDYERPDNYIVKNTSYSDKAKTPVLTANKSFVLGYTDEDFGIYGDVPAIIFDDFTTDSKYVNFPFKIKSSAIKILKCKDKTSDLKFIHEKMKLVKFPVSNHKRYYISQYQNLEILLPEKFEQQKIAEVLGTVDEDIAKTQEVIEATEKLKRGLMQQLFTRGIGHTKFKDTRIGQIPEEWELVKMKDICTVRQGLQIAISQRFPEYKEGRYKYITLKSIKENIYDYIESPKQSVICTKDDVLMTRTGNTGVVMTDREGVFHNNFFLIDFDRSRVLKNYLVYYFLRDDIKKIVLEKAGTTTIPDLNHDAFYGVDFVIPNLQEQEEITEILLAVDGKISINKKLKEKLTLLKKGLMQDLLSGKVRTDHFPDTGKMVQ